ncbi:unnamed protein product [Phaedon cochleariae]|uniref:Protein kinase domain-containing protein n=1 Tax=Phaedon cochleariae TaxID=80249 RepID=A0A9N9X5Q0_PHACE|nr:unnamed protein product [Phaedon cochleariae]
MPHRRKNKKVTRRNLGKPRQSTGGCVDDHLITESNEMDIQSTQTVSAGDDSKNKITINEVNKTETNKNEENNKTKEHETTDCLVLLMKIVNKFRVENNTFLDIMKNIMCVTDTKDTASKKIKYDLINTMLVILSESNMQELTFIQNKVKAISTSKQMYNLYVDDEAIERKEILVDIGVKKLGKTDLGHHLTIQNIGRILIDVASGMEYIHGKRFLHRDLASQNIFIDDNKRCKIGDFGSCVFVGDSNGVFEEKKFRHLGYNISPETLTSQLFTMESDVWSMGILIWFIFNSLAIKSRSTTINFIPGFMVQLYIKAFQTGQDE